MTRRGETVYNRFHPSDDCWAGEKTRRFLLAEGRSAHFAAAIFYILDVLRSILLTPWRLHDHVIYVRYLMGTAYLPPPLHIFAHHFFSTILPKPRHTFFLDVDPREAHRRITENRSQLEMFESIEQLRKIGRRAVSLAQANRWTIIDANRPAEEVEGQIRAEVNR